MTLANCRFLNGGQHVTPELAELAESSYDALLGRIGKLGLGTQVEPTFSVMEAVEEDLKENQLPDEVKELVRCYLSDLYVADMKECSLRGMVSEG